MMVFNKLRFIKNPVINGKLIGRISKRTAKINFFASNYNAEEKIVVSF